MAPIVDVLRNAVLVLVREELLRDESTREAGRGGCLDVEFVQLIVHGGGKTTDSVVVIYLTIRSHLVFNKHLVVEVVREKTLEY